MNSRSSSNSANAIAPTTGRGGEKKVVSYFDLTRLPGVKGSAHHVPVKFRISKAFGTTTASPRSGSDLIMPRRDADEESNSDDELTPASYPTKLIGRILQETFQNPNTRISADALTVVTEYLRIYTREAIWRAAQEKKRTETVAGTLGTGLLEVEDLEKITGPLTLDFS